MNLSKTRLMAGRQCRRRLRLEVHRPDLLEHDAAVEQVFAFGHRVNEVARALEAGGTLIGHGDDPGRALAETRAALSERGDRTLFEPAFVHEGIFVRADVLRRQRNRHALVADEPLRRGALDARAAVAHAARPSAPSEENHRARDSRAARQPAHAHPRRHRGGARARRPVRLRGSRQDSRGARRRRATEIARERGGDRVHPVLTGAKTARRFLAARRPRL